MDKDNFWVRAEEDDGSDRQYFSVECCPCADDCSSQSWSRVQRSGFDIEVLQNAVKQHLVASSLHSLDPVTADSYCAAIDFVPYTETWADREAYRKQVESAQKNKGKGEGKGKKSKGKEKKGEGEPSAKRQRTGGELPPPEPDDMAVAQQLVQHVSRLTAAIEAGALGQQDPSTAAGIPSGSGSAGPAVPAPTSVVAPAPEIVQVPLRQAQLLYESLSRAQQASDACHRSCQKLSQQFQQESVVIQRAQMGLKHILLQHGGLSCVPGGAEEMQWTG